jgi:hypothetical protein
MHELHVAFTQGLMIGVIIGFCGGFLLAMEKQQT